MASIRNLKKDIEYLVFEVVSDCFTFAGLYPGKNTEELSDIIEEAIQLRNSLYTKVNNPEKDDDAAKKKAHFKSVRKELFTGVNNLFDRLSKVTQEK